VSDFLGLPVSGEVPGTDIRYTPPRSLAELEPLFRAVLDDEGVAEFGWTQSDPVEDTFAEYVFEVWFRAAGDTEGHELRGHPTIGPGDRYDRCAALDDALSRGWFDEVLRESLGEECSVRVSRTLITVTEC
jgi:hypothetical protein